MKTTTEQEGNRGSFNKDLLNSCHVQGNVVTLWNTKTTWSLLFWSLQILIETAINQITSEINVKTKFWVHGRRGLCCYKYTIRNLTESGEVKWRNDNWLEIWTMGSCQLGEEGRENFSGERRWQGWRNYNENMENMRYREKTILAGTESMERNVYEAKDRGGGVKDGFVLSVS